MFIGVRVWRETWIGEERNQYKERHRKEKETKITDAKTKENEIERGRVSEKRRETERGQSCCSNSMIDAL